MKHWFKALRNKKKNTTYKAGGMRAVMPSLIAIAVCSVCLTGTTFAWLSTSRSSAAQKLSAANFDIDVSIVEQTVAVGVQEQQEADNIAVLREEIPVTANETGEYMLSADKTYSITLSAAGSAQESGGYCVITNGTATYYTKQIQPQASMSFVLIPESDAVYKFTSVWGMYSEEATEGIMIIMPGATVGEMSDGTDPVEPAEPTVTPTPTPEATPTETPTPAPTTTPQPTQEPEPIPEASDGTVPSVTPAPAPAEEGDGASVPPEPTPTDIPETGTEPAPVSGGEQAPSDAVESFNYYENGGNVQ